MALRDRTVVGKASRQRPRRPSTWRRSLKSLARPGCSAANHAGLRRRKYKSKRALQGGAPSAKFLRSIDGCAAAAAQAGRVRPLHHQRHRLRRGRRRSEALSVRRSANCCETPNETLERPQKSWFRMARGLIRDRRLVARQFAKAAQHLLEMRSFRPETRRIKPRRRATESSVRSAILVSKLLRR